MVHFEFVQGTVNRFVYCQILGRLREAVRKRRPSIWAASGDRQHQLYLHQDNAPAHNALMTQARLMETPPGVQSRHGSFRLYFVSLSEERTQRKAIPKLGCTQG